MKHNKPFSFFGSLGYQVIGIDSSNDVYCWECIPLDENDKTPDGFVIRGYEEGCSLHCCECNTDIESDYGDPELGD